MLCLLLIGRKKERKKEKWLEGVLFFPGQDMPCWLCHLGFSKLLGVIKGWFKAQSSNFICT
jgi:hypothetical protein